MSLCLVPPSQGSVWQTRYVVRVDEYTEQPPLQGCGDGVTLSLLSLTERDAFDTLFDHAPDKLNVVKKVCRRGSRVLRYHRRPHADLTYANQKC